MNYTIRICMCILLVVALATPALCGNHSTSTLGNLYTQSAAAGDQVGAALNGCLKRTFSLFNPCLDLVKGCTSIALIPIEAPFNLVSRLTCSSPPVHKHAPKLPMPKKPELPKK
jgi:hypothetical protein